MEIAIYDLDKTITRRPTFTHFLLFYARREASYRLAALPIWIAALLGYRIGLYGRKPLKQFGIAIFIGRKICPVAMARNASDFASMVFEHNIQPGAQQSIAVDKSKSRRLVLATAAPEFYASEIAARLGFGDVIATRHKMTSEGLISNEIDGENCYGREKLKMVTKWLDDQQLFREQCIIWAYSDHPSDAPLLDWADTSFLVNPSKKLRRFAHHKNWLVQNFAADAVKF
jgi:phosphatidylglycerophosphatase C